MQGGIQINLTSSMGVKLIGEYHKNNRLHKLVIEEIKVDGCTWQGVLGGVLNVPAQ